MLLHKHILIYRNSKSVKKLYTRCKVFTFFTIRPCPKHNHSGGGCEAPRQAHLRRVRDGRKGEPAPQKKANLKPINVISIASEHPHSQTEGESTAESPIAPESLEIMGFSVLAPLYVRDIEKVVSAHKQT